MDLKPENFTIEKEIIVFCFPAEEFPDGIPAAHEEIQERITKLTNKSPRRFFGISHPNEEGNIVYYAAAEQLETGEADKLGLDFFDIKPGTYTSMIVKDYDADIMKIAESFDELLQNPDIDPEGYCLEWYFNDTDVRCMVPLIERNDQQK